MEKRSKSFTTNCRNPSNQRFVWFVWLVVKFFLLFVINSNIFAQEAAQETPEITEETPVTEEEAPEDINRLSASEIMQINMEIRSSTLSELALWCRTLELSESGTREELSGRIKEHFNISETPPPANQKIITIESAHTSEYFSINVIGEDYARLKGEVKLSLKDGDKTHKINADEILFNRTRNIITAKGNVMYEKAEGTSVETFRGESITVNINNWSSIFLDGNSEKKLESDGSAYLFSGKIISRSDEDTTILRKAKISNAANEEALWSISASKIWLLPGADFAILNAVLKVGEIPVMYFPAFYYPADELVFHPVIGFRTREGGFVQTTTYILGRPKADAAEQSTLTRILGNTNDEEKELHGLFLRTTGKKIVNPDEISLKLLLDYYVNLGAYAGLDFYTPKKGVIDPFNLSLGLGFSRTITDLKNGSYTPYVEKDDGLYDGSYNWDQSNLFSTMVPFRYRMTMESAISGKHGRLAWNFPFYSDPTIDRDFLKRSESMDWANMIKQGGSIGEEETDDTTRIGDYRWNMNGNINLSLPKLSPVISRVSISNISTSLTFKEIEDKAQNLNAPERYFYAPDKYAIYNFSGSVAGTPLTLGKNQQKAAAPKQEQNDPFKGFGIPISPFSANSDEEENTKKSKSEDIITPPALGNSFSIPGAGNNTFTVDYSFSPTSSSEMQFWTSNWSTYEDVNWSEYQSILINVKGRGTLNLRLDHSSGFYSNSVSFNSDAAWQDYTYLNEEFYRKADDTIDEKKMNEDKQRQYSQTNYLTTYTYNTTLRPLYRNLIFGQSNLQYTFGGTLVKSKKYVAADSPDGPELTPQWGSWVKQDASKDIYGLSSHRFSTSLDANVMDKKQNLTLSADLPPLDGLYSASAAVRVWISETTANTRIEELITKNNEGVITETKWKFHPINLTETLRFGKANSFTYNMVINPEENEVDRINSTLKLWDFSAMFSAAQGKKSTFEFKDPNNTNSGGEWKYETGEPSLLSKELKFEYNKSSANIEIVKNVFNLTFNVRTSLTFDLQRYTNSNFQFSTGFTANITGFLQLSFTFSAINSIIWRYFKNFPGMESKTFMYPDGPQNNVFRDLADSFNFFDESKRRRSGFKMKDLNLTATHFLGDWVAEFGVGVYPWKGDKDEKYKITTDFSFLVKWNPIQEIKTSYTFNGKTNTFTKNE